MSNKAIIDLFVTYQVQGITADPLKLLVDVCLKKYQFALAHFMATFHRLTGRPGRLTW